jgi:hypothetical protein
MNNSNIPPDNLQRSNPREQSNPNRKPGRQRGGQEPHPGGRHGGEKPGHQGGQRSQGDDSSRFRTGLRNLFASGHEA